MTDWGRIDADGTVYVRTAEGERAVGSWQAGDPLAGLALYQRRFGQLATEVSLLEQRLATGSGDPRQIAASAARLAETLPTAAAVGDLAALQVRVDTLLGRTAAAVEQASEARAAARAQAVADKTALAEEAERLASGSDWKGAGERLRALGEEWKRIVGADRKTDEELWQRVAVARQRFAERRTAHFGALEAQREVSRERKEKLIKTAEGLAGSKDWKETAERFKALMGEWKSAGRAPREVEDLLWERFKAAQDAFFTARHAVFAEKDSELRENQQVKEALLAEAEKIDVAAGLEAAKKRLRELQERWEAAGKVPREVMRSLEDRMTAVEQRVRGAADRSFHRAAESPFVARLREKVEELEVKLAKAQAAGRDTGELEAALQTQREWLRPAGQGTAPEAPRPAPAEAPAGKSPKAARGTAWVRAADS